MFSEKAVNSLSWGSNGSRVVFLSLLMMCVLPIVRAQESPTSSQETQMRLKSELHKMPGKVIAEGRNTNQSKGVPVERYTVEELQLDEPIEAEIGKKKMEVYQAYRITVFGGPFHLRAMPLVLTIDDKTTVSGFQAPLLDKATFILYDRSLLLGKPTLMIGYGAATKELTDKLILVEPRK